MRQKKKEVINKQVLFIIAILLLGFLAGAFLAKTGFATKRRAPGDGGSSTCWAQYTDCDDNYFRCGYHGVYCSTGQYCCINCWPSGCSEKQCYPISGKCVV